MWYADRTGEDTEEEAAAAAAATGKEKEKEITRQASPDSVVSTQEVDLRIQHGGCLELGVDLSYAMK